MTEAQSTATPPPRNSVRGARRAAIIAIIVSLSATALVGIVVLLSGSSSDTLSRILLTTLVLAAFSVTSLCHLAVVGKAPQLVGFAGLVSSIGAFVTAEVLVWSSDVLSSDASQNWFRVLGVLTVLALSLAHTNLMLLLQSRKRRIVRMGLRVTLVLITLVAIGIWIPLLDNGTFPDANAQWYWRLFGVFAILDVLGTIVLPVTGAILRDVPRLPEARLTVPPELVVKLDALAEKEHTTRDAVALDILRRGIGG